MGLNLPRPDLRLAGIVVIAALATAGCEDKKQAQVQGTAGGEVLPGSVSDAMLPVDTVRSQPPLAPKSEPSGAKSGQSDVPAKPKSASSAPPTAAPTEEPQAEKSADE